MTDDNDYSGAFDDPAERAFDRAEGYFLLGEKLEAFSGRRRRIAERLGLRFFQVLGGDEFDDFLESKTYAGFEDDMCLTLWLCSVGRERCTRARRYPERAFEEIDDWADERGIYPGGKGHAEACTVFTEIVTDILASLAVPEGGAGGDGEDAPGKSAASGQPTSSPSQTRQDLISNGAPGKSPIVGDSNTSPATTSGTEPR